MRFNTQQQKAINHVKGACAVIAGAGSGKSTVLVNRIANLINNHNVKEETILATTFTRNSSLDLKKKLAKLGIEGVNVGTFHSVCARILAQNGYNIRATLKSYEIDNLFRKVMDDNSVNTDDIQSYISYQKNYMRGVDDEFVYKDSEYTEEDLRECYIEYEKLKAKKKAMDFDDYLLVGYKFLTENPDKFTPYEYILVDEHQDSNLVQNKLINLLCRNGNVFCVFDYRQAIYTFRGGNPTYCMNFAKDYEGAEIINLDCNYRSTTTIVENANRFIEYYYGDYEYYSPSKANNEELAPTSYFPPVSSNTEGRLVVNQIQQLLADGVDYKDIAVLYRNNNQVVFVENELKLAEIPYEIKDNGGFFKLKEVNLILCVLRLIDNPADDGAFEDIAKARVGVFQYMRNTTMEALRELCANKNLTLLDGCDLLNVGDRRQTGNLVRFSESISSLTRQHKRHIDLLKIIENIIVMFDLKGYIRNNYTSDEAIEERLTYLENLKTFVRSNTVESFLEYVYCKSAIQDKKKSEDKIRLMTIHGSKGLEFKYVFLIGNEEGKFPSTNSPEIDEARLFYVGVTRAIEKMWISETDCGSHFVTRYRANDI